MEKQMPSKAKLWMRTAEMRLQLGGRLRFVCAFVIAAPLIAGVAAVGQQTAPVTNVPAHPVQLAATFDLERGSVATVGCGCFWLKGGTGEFSVPVIRNLDFVAAFGGAEKVNFQPGVDFNKLSYLFGPRYEIDTTRTTKHKSTVFAEGLVGVVHGFRSVFPGPAINSPTANSLAVQLGGGIDIGAGHGFSVRAVEVDYVRTTLPNNAGNVQNNFRIAFGGSYRFGPH